MQERIFHAFSQADDSTNRQYGGTGLGLNITRQLVELMDGDIGVESQLGEGSRFWFQIPYTQPRVASGQFTASTQLTGLRVLIVDDNGTNREILEHLLENWQVSHRSAASGREALAILQNRQPGENFHLMLLDMMMPEMDGLAVAAAIRKHPEYDDLKILILSSMDHAEDIMEDTQYGLSGYILKPVRQSVLYNNLLATMGEIAPDDTVMESTGEDVVEAKKARLLVVEDNKINQKVIMGMLKYYGFEAEFVENGEQGLAAVQERDFDLIFMDVQMPVMDGFTATRKIREHEGDGHHTPIIAMTANAMQGDREKCLEAGMDDYLSKPLKPEVLNEVIQKWLDGQS